MLFDFLCIVHIFFPTQSVYCSFDVNCGVNFDKGVSKRSLYDQTYLNMPKKGAINYFCSSQSH